MKKLILLLIPYCLLALANCRPVTRSEMPKDESMEQLLRENPDSLAILLEEKINPNTLSAGDKANYALWLTKIHIKQNRNLMNDTLIRYTLEYYKKTGSPHLLDAYLLAAEQINWADTARLQKERLLNEAMQIAIEQKDTTIIQQICSQLTNLCKMPADSEKIRDLIQITKQYAGTDQDFNSYDNLVKQFGLLSQFDSLFFYVKKGIDLARNRNDQAEYILTRHYINALNVSGKSREALSVLRDLEHRMPGGSELQLNYIVTWINLGQLDSAQLYINSFNSLLDNFKKSEGIYDVFVEIHLFKLLSSSLQEVARAKEGKFLSITEMNDAAGELLSTIRNRMKINREQEFIQNKLIRNNLVLEIEKEQMKQRLLWAGIIVLLVIILIIYIYQQKLLKKERSFQKAKEQLRMHTLQLTKNESIISKNQELISSLSSQIDENDDLKQEITLLNEENDALKEKNKILQKDMEQTAKSMRETDADFDVFEKLAEQNARLQERERFLTARLIAHTEILDRLSKKPRYIEKSQWYEIINAVNQLFDGFSYRIHIDFPVLTEEDIFYCCLFKLRLSTSIVGILMGISPSSVTKRKQRIKEKMSQQFSDENRYEQLLEIYSWN